MNRRTYLASFGCAGTLASAGCLSDVIDDLTTFEASPATVSADAVAEAGYEHQETEEWIEEREFAGESVEVTNYISEYTRTISVLSIDVADAGVFATIASPQVSVAGQQFNPLAEMSNEALLEEIQQQYEELSVGSAIDVRTVESLGQTIEVETFEGTASLVDELGIDVLVDVTQPDHDGDHLALVGIYPANVPSEATRVTTLIEGLEHGDGDGEG